MQHSAPWHARLALVLALLLPVYFAAAALGTKFNLWSWQFGLLTLTALGGLVVMGAVALFALVSLIVCLRRSPKLGWRSALAGLLIPAAIMGFLMVSLAGAGSHPIHDVATDTSNPPELSAKVMADRATAEANPINAYDTPLGQTEQFAGAQPPLSQQTYAEIIAENYPDLKSLPLEKTSVDEAVNAVQLAMADMGMTQIRYNRESGTVEALAETFWFGFKDDVVARVGEDQIDFRSVSRVGQSDLGANSKRIMDLRDRIAEKLAR
ncbi:MAG: DUF1499 domain-containing protein [Pseudomonadota bacterium]